MFNHGIEIGRGGVFLNLTEEQYTKLKEVRLAKESDR